MSADLKPSAIESAFNEFHALNPHVYRALVRLARDLVQRGHSKVGIGMLFEVLRWRHAMTTTGDVDFKLNNNYRSYYARLIMAREPDLDGAFEIRRLHVPEPFGQVPAAAPVGHVAPPVVIPGSGRLF